MKSVAVILLSYNSVESTTKPCVESILNSAGNIPFELIIVDNLSIDGTRQYLSVLNLEHTAINIILNDANYGYQKAKKWKLFNGL